MLVMLSHLMYTIGGRSTKNKNRKGMVKMRKTVELQPIHDGRKSFYKKAHVIEEGNNKYLISYTTEVAKIIGDKLTLNGFYSATTLRHIKEFIQQNGFQSGSKAELEEMYM